MPAPSPGVVCIRPIEAGDGPSLQLLGADARVAATCHIEHPLPPGSGEAFALRAVQARRRGDWYGWTVLVDGSVAGVVALDGLCRCEHRANLFYWLGQAYWGRGLATQVAAAAVDAARGLGLQVLEATTLAEHQASARVLQKIGFQRQASAALHGPDAGKFSGRRVVRWWATLAA